MEVREMVAHSTTALCMMAGDPFTWQNIYNAFLSDDAPATKP
jgi:hypothetical protein